MIYTYTTHALDPHNGFVLAFSTFVAVTVFVFVTFITIMNDTKFRIIKLVPPFMVGILTLSFTATSMWGEPYANEKVIATLVEYGDAQYKSGKSSYVKGATVTYRLPDGGLVTYRADDGSAWYPEIILYKNAKR